MQTTNNLFLNTAFNIGIDLVKASIWDDKNRCNWLGYWIDLVDGQYKPITRTFGADLYSGTSGIALFLAALYQQTGDALIHKTLLGTVEQVRSVTHNVPDHGFYSGKAGVAFTLVKVGGILHREDIVKEGLALLKALRTTGFQQHETDMISGIAGTIPVLVDFYKTTADPQYLEMAIKLGASLCDMADKEPHQWSWKTVPSNKNLTGFSHGVSGIANSLLLLHSVTNNNLFLNAAVMAFNYEQNQFDAAQQNWPDYREDVLSTTGKHNCGNAWCHGAPGIAMSRIKANKLAPSAAYHTQAQVALQTTAKNIVECLQNTAAVSNYSLCHGIAGNADVLLESGQPQYIELAKAAGMAGIHKYGQTGQPWPTGLNSTQYTPGIMMGLAGTGYFYLRLHDAQKNKSVLYPEM